jgi:hypothetical protein
MHQLRFCGNPFLGAQYGVSVADVLAHETLVKRSSVWAVVAGGGIAGTLDLLQACIWFGWDIPLVIAGGLLGRKAFNGGAGTYLLGVALHYFIAFSAAAVYSSASQRLSYLKESWVICGLFFGAAVDTLMRLIVLPLSALHSHGPYELKDLLKGLVVHMIVVGLPIAYSTKRFASR